MADRVDVVRAAFRLEHLGRRIEKAIPRATWTDCTGEGAAVSANKCLPHEGSSLMTIAVALEVVALLQEQVRAGWVVPV